MNQNLKVVQLQQGFTSKQCKIQVQILLKFTLEMIPIFQNSKLIGSNAK